MSNQVEPGHIAGQIAGIVVAGAIAVLAAVAYVLWSRRRRRRWEEEKLAAPLSVRLDEPSSLAPVLPHPYASTKTIREREDSCRVNTREPYPSSETGTSAGSMAVGVGGTDADVEAQRSPDIPNVPLEAQFHESKRSMSTSHGMVKQSTPTQNGSNGSKRPIATPLGDNGSRQAPDAGIRLAGGPRDHPADEATSTLPGAIVVEWAPA
ncbi:hypothetical protein BD413DRAFT_617118 [Trametes elegans]|nr:hypothetical protein BD413DRAFT_617118 [Trametes elegans]